MPNAPKAIILRYEWLGTMPTGTRACYPLPIPIAVERVIAARGQLSRQAGIRGSEANRLPTIRHRQSRAASVPRSKRKSKTDPTVFPEADGRSRN